MPRLRKTSVQKILKPGHLQAIGLVAAQWSSLELIILYAIGEISGTNLSLSIVLAGPSNVSTWMDMLDKMLTEPNSINELKVITKEISELQPMRNGIVHSAWQDDAPRTIDAWHKGQSSDLAMGLGITKRGKKVFLKVKYTANELRAIARRIEAVELELHDWVRRQQPKPFGY